MSDIPNIFEETIAYEMQNCEETMEKFRKLEQMCGEKLGKLLEKKDAKQFEARKNSPWWLPLKFAA